ncbi:hypothetical protein Tco_0501888 [Tanacetum coccineum]
MKRTAYWRIIPVVTSLVKVKEKSHERVLDVESKEEPKEDPQEDSEEEGEPKKRLKKASESDSNTLPPDYTAPNEETETDFDSTARCEAKPKELESTCERGFWLTKTNETSNAKRRCDRAYSVDREDGARGHKAVLGMTWEEFKALLVEEFCPSNEKMVEN